MLKNYVVDALTGGYTEGWMADQYQQVVEEKRPDYALLTLKIKRFSHINRVLGREKGDLLLKKVYHAIQDWLQPEEWAVRAYADYFNILARFPTVEAVEQRVVDLIVSLRTLPDEQLNGRVFVGMGVYRMVEPAVPFHVAQYNADSCRSDSQQAAYRNSHYEIYDYTYRGQNDLFYDLEDQIMPAVLAGEFQFYLQPKVSLATGQVASAEALLRWVDPKRGIIPLNTFLPGLEENGYIRDVDLYIFDQVCACIARWQQKYDKSITISVNLSKAYFEDEYFVPDYLSVFEKHHISAASLNIEFIENIVMDRVERMNSIVARLRDYGFGCALDDFGSGFSSYRILASVPMQELKLDRSLFANLHNRREETVVRHIIATARELGMATVAEGIEDPAYVGRLRESGCDYIQGYVFFRPMPVEEFERRFLQEDEQVDLSRYQ